MAKIDPIYTELAAQIQGADKEYIPRILARLVSPEQARLLKALPDADRDASAGRSLKVSDKFAEKVGLDRATVERHLRELYEKGVIFPTRNGPQMARTYIQLHDSTLGNSKFDQALGDEFFDLWAAAEGRPHKPRVEEFKPDVAVFRVVPRWKSVKDVVGVLPQEDVREILKKQDLLVLLHCGCKRSYRERDCHMPDESCITVGRTAQYNLDRGVGRKITYEEALEVLDKYDKLGAVNLTVNQKEVNQLVCNCHWCCCIAVGRAAKSRFVATVDPQKCRACQVCVKRCQYGAVSMKFYPEVNAERAYVDAEVCRGCGLCVVSCRAGARQMKAVRPPEHIPDALAIY